jgi:glycosyltransferase involved in cell wall biosynthesis
MQTDAAAVDLRSAGPVASIEDETPGYCVPQGLVDVVIPMRDGAATILATIASVLAQTHPPDHIFVIDDGSRDGGAELLRMRQFPSVSVVATAARGVSHARNVGIACSRAEFIAFLDCDDLWHPHKLERQLTVARENCQAAVITCGSMAFDMQHNPIPGTRFSPTLRGSVFEKTLKQGFIRGGLSSNMLVRRSALLAVGGFDENMSFAEDNDLWFRLARRYSFDYCREPLAHIVENPQSTMRRMATPALRREVLLQILCSLEKWIDARSSNRWVLAFAARSILTYAARERLTAKQMWRLREEIVARAPVIGRRLAKTRALMVTAAILAGFVYLPSVWGTWSLRRRRLRSWKKRAAGTGEHTLPKSVDHEPLA